MVRKGDTLIEVTLAIGIFSMVAIAIVSVMSSGTTGAQTALETTLAREEIDTQAEAIRFIQISSIADQDTSDRRFEALWKKITDNAVSADSEILQYTPDTCLSLYADGGEVQNYNGFVINNYKLGTFDASTIDSVYISAKENAGYFAQASTYPRLVFNNSASNLDDTTSSSNEFYRAEGLYIIAVKEDPSGGEYNPTTVVDGDGVTKRPAFYDFYIRSCWYGMNATEPSTISTVIRLYDPSAVTVK
ncbi:hypothetical protein IKG49_03720 [Candidatus Saccharibacteria bacterium]|nr:hypothetical protein [Candidatus Saccharibacteria bacterium]